MYAYKYIHEKIINNPMSHNNPEDSKITLKIKFVLTIGLIYIDDVIYIAGE